MERSIQHFLDEWAIRLQIIFNDGYSSPEDLNYVITSVFEETGRLAKDILKDYLESIDQDIFESRLCKHYYKSEGFSSRALITSPGEVTFRLRWYTGKEDSSSAALLEKALLPVDWPFFQRYYEHVHKNKWHAFSGGGARCRRSFIIRKTGSFRQPGTDCGMETCLLFRSGAWQRTAISPWGPSTTISAIKKA